MLAQKYQIQLQVKMKLWQQLCFLFQCRMYSLVTWRAASHSRHKKQTTSTPHSLRRMDKRIEPTLTWSCCSPVGFVSETLAQLQDQKQK